MPAPALNVDLELLPVGVALFDTELRFVRLNRRIADFNGVPVEEHLGRTLREIIPAVADVVEPLLRDVLSTGQPVLNHETRATTPARPGALRYWQESFHPIRNETGEIVGIQASVEEITEREQAEIQLQLSETRHRQLADHSADVIWTMNLDGRFTYMSPAIESLRGYTPEEALAMDFSEIFAPDSLAKVLDGLRAAQQQVQAGLPISFHEQLQERRKDGGYVWTDVKATTLFDEHGRFVEILGITRDISELKAAEARLAAREAWMRRMLDQIPLPLAINNVEDRRVLFLNESFIRTFGYNLAELSTIDDWARLAYPDAAYLEAAMSDWYAAEEQARATQGRIASAEYRVCRKDGQQRDVLISATVHDDSMLVSLVDLTERKRMEDALRESEARFRGYFDLPLIGIAITSPDKGWLDVNERLCDILGYSRDQLLRTTWAEITHPDDLAENNARFEHVLAGDIDGFSLEKRFIRGDGTALPAEISVHCVRDSEGRPLYFTSLVQDISRRRQAEEALRVSEERFRRAFDNANTGMCLVGPGGDILQVNAKMSEIFGYSRQELERMTVNDLSLPEDTRLSPAFIRGAMSGYQDSATFEKRYRHRSGQIIHGQVASSLVRDADGHPLYFISQVQDITARKQAEDELRQAQAEILRQAVERSQLEERERLLQDLHDGFGSQLTSARLRVEEGALSQAELAELLRECMTDLHLVVDTMNSPGMTLAEALRHLRNRYRQRLAGRPPELSWDLALDECPPLTDSQRLTLLRIIQEGLNNALKHSGAGHIRISARQTGTSPLEVRILDDGVGFPEHLRPGKGLHHLRSRVQSLGGTLDLSHPDGQAGAALIIDIPLTGRTESSASALPGSDRPCAK